MNCDITERTCSILIHSMQARFICKGGMAGDKPKLVATVQHEGSGRCLEVFSTAPGMQLYGKRGRLH
jgi:hypothetical protein